MTEKVEIAFCRRATFEETKDALAALMSGQARFGTETAVSQHAAYDRTETLRLGHEIVPRPVRTFIVAALHEKGSSYTMMVDPPNDARSEWRVWIEGDEPVKKPKPEPGHVETETEMRAKPPAPDRRPWWQRMVQA